MSNSLTGKFRAYGQKVEQVATTDTMLEENSTTIGDDQHPAFKLLAFWHSQGVIGVDTVAHHA